MSSHEQFLADVEADLARLTSVLLEVEEEEEEGGLVQVTMVTSNKSHLDNSWNYAPTDILRKPTMCQVVEYPLTP